MCTFVKNFFASVTDKLPLVFPDHSLDDADDLGMGAVDGFVIVVFRKKPDLPVSPAQTLNSGLIFDPCNHDLAVIGALLGPDDHLVAV